MMNSGIELLRRAASSLQPDFPELFRSQDGKHNYLSYVTIGARVGIVVPQEEIHFEPQASQILRNDLTVVTLSLRF